MMNIMGIYVKTQHRIHTYYRQEIVCKQHLMLTSASRIEWHKKGAFAITESNKYFLTHLSIVYLYER